MRFDLLNPISRSGRLRERAWRKIRAGRNAFKLSGFSSSGPCGCCEGSCIVRVSVFGCDATLALSVEGATVNVWTDSSKTTLIDSGTTVFGGYYDADVGTAGTYYLEIIASRFNTYTGSRSFVCGGSLGQTLTPASGYHCLNGMSCPLPLSDTLYATHSVFGTVTLSWVSTDTWTGTGSYSYSGCGDPAYCVSPPCAGTSVGFTVGLLRASGVVQMYIDFSWNSSAFCPGGPNLNREVYSVSFSRTCSPLGLTIESFPTSVKKCLYCSNTTNYTFTVTE